MESVGAGPDNTNTLKALTLLLKYVNSYCQVKQAHLT